MLYKFLGEYSVCSNARDIAEELSAMVYKFLGEYSFCSNARNIAEEFNAADGKSSGENPSCRIDSLAPSRRESMPTGKKVYFSGNTHKLLGTLS